ncbi:MAG: phospholipid carrier-dependent glycosyltransferase, partial [Elusimicrobia bacterium]|nr:phospholipid carrier-dependent glycosyltransferase [Elusimicrobiota bacterium]
IYTLALAIQGELAAHWINFWHGGLLMATTACLLRRYFGKEAILLALATFALQPIFQRVIGNASTDFPIAWAGLISFFCFFRAQETLQENTVSQETARPWYLLTGLCCGLAMGYKLTGTWIAATVSILILSSKFQRPFFLWTLLGIVLGGFPWYLRNLILTGNPIWPYLSGLFPATNLEKEAWLRIKVSVTEGIEKNLGNWFSLPIQILLRPAQFLYASHYLLLPFYGLLFWKCARPEPFRKIEKQIFLLLLVFSSLWFWTYQNWRYFLPAAGLIVVLTSAWTQELLREKGRWKMIACVILFAWIPVLHLSWSNELFPFLDVRSAQFPDRPAKERYLELTLGAPYLLCQVANQTLPKDAKVFFFRDFRGYYLDRDYAWGDPLNPGLFSYSSIKERSALLKELKNFGFTHILYNPTIGHYQGDAAYYERSNQRMQELLTHDAELLFTGGELRLFRINYSKPEAPPTNPSFR